MDILNVEDPHDAAVAWMELMYLYRLWHSVLDL